MSRFIQARLNHILEQYTPAIEPQITLCSNCQVREAHPEATMCMPCINVEWNTPRKPFR